MPVPVPVFPRKCGLLIVHQHIFMIFTKYNTLMRYNGSCEKREVLIKWCSPGEFALSRHVLREREACGYMENFSLGKTGSIPCCPAVVAKWPQGHLADLMP